MFSLTKGYSQICFPFTFSQIEESVFHLKNRYADSAQNQCAGPLSQISVQSSEQEAKHQSLPSLYTVHFHQSIFSLHYKKVVSWTVLPACWELCQHTAHIS